MPGRYSEDELIAKLFAPLAGAAALGLKDDVALLPPQGASLAITADMLVAEPWNRPSTREKACFPPPGQHDYKFWPAVGRVDNVYGDRNLQCSCPTMEEYAA